MSANPLGRRTIAAVSVGAGVVGVHGAAYAFFATRNPYTETIFPPCILLHFTGLQCPGCGGTRALYSLLHGDLITSLQLNPLVIAGYLAVLFAVTGTLLPARYGRLSRVLYASAATVSLAALAWSMVIRNLF